MAVELTFSKIEFKVKHLFFGSLNEIYMIYI